MSALKHKNTYPTWNGYEFFVLVPTAQNPTVDRGKLKRKIRRSKTTRSQRGNVPQFIWCGKVDAKNFVRPSPLHIKKHLTLSAGESGTWARRSKIRPQQHAHLKFTCCVVYFYIHRIRIYIHGCHTGASAAVTHIRKQRHQDWSLRRNCERERKSSWKCVSRPVENYFLRDEHRRWHFSFCPLLADSLLSEKIVEDANPKRKKDRGKVKNGT